MTGLALDGNVASHHLAKALADGETKPGAPVFARRGRGCLGKLLEQPTHLSGVMPMPVSATAIAIQSRPFSCP